MFIRVFALLPDHSIGYGGGHYKTVEAHINPDKINGFFAGDIQNYNPCTTVLFSDGATMILQGRPEKLAAQLNEAKSD